MSFERRQHCRVDITTACRIVARDKNSFPSEGLTENISRNGLMFQVSGAGLQQLPAPGDAMTVEVLMANNQRFGQRCLRCRGQVVRILSSRECVRIAIAISHMEFRDAAENGQRRQVGSKVWSALLYRA